MVQANNKPLILQVYLTDGDTIFEPPDGWREYHEEDLPFIAVLNSDRFSRGRIAFYEYTKPFEDREATANEFLKKLRCPENRIHGYVVEDVSGQQAEIDRLEKIRCGLDKKTAKDG
ncbi:MAG: hypothetical protein RID91_13185 [Azospirillaceae bacterium]